MNRYFLDLLILLGEIFYFVVNCAPVCKSCEMKHVETRCPKDPEAKDALEPGDLDKLFEHIVTDPYYKQYDPVVLSRPTYAQGDTADTANYKIGLWMIMLENIVSDAEADRMIELGGIRGYERSSDVGAEKEDGTFTKNVNSGRTSTNAWCTDECYTDPVAIALMERIVNITGIPEPYSENLQLLRYEKDQYYHVRDCYSSCCCHACCFVSITYLHQTLLSDLFLYRHTTTTFLTSSIAPVESVS